MSYNKAKEQEMARFAVSPEKEKALLERMERLDIRESDIEEKFVRSGGKGGQKVNKVSTCVYLKHIPTGVEVKCQKERYQALNRFLARRILADKIERMILGKRAAEEQRIEKLRRQKRKRSRRAKLKMLEEKRKHSEKKKARAFRPGRED
jgi:protein subunit release factor B